MILRIDDVIAAAAHSGPGPQDVPDMDDMM
jgi:hypothetical protein